LTRYNVEISPEVKGKKLGRVFQLLLERPQFAQSVSDQKSMVIALQPLNIQDGEVIDIVYRAEGQDDPLERAVTYHVRFVTPTPIDVGAFINLLTATSTTPAFPQQLETIQALNVLLGHQPQANDGVVSIGRNRHFSIDRSHQNTRNIQILGGGMEALRGYFQSVRPATGGLLLNVNVTHGVFFEPIPLSQLMPKMGTGNKVTLQKKLKKIRVNVTHLPVKKSKVTNLDIPRVKIIFALATQQDGRGEQHPPQIKEFGAGPKGVKFWLSAPPGAPTDSGGKGGKGKSPKKPAGPAPPANAYISVYDYFSKRKHAELSPSKN
jgi:hypothetical protein